MRNFDGARLSGFAGYGGAKRCLFADGKYGAPLREGAAIGAADTPRELHKQHGAAYWQSQ